MPIEKLLNLSWVMIATALVLFMQAGFAALESGATRSKNTINVAIKNLVDLCVTGLFFWALGFGLMFGLSQGGIVGTSGFFFSGSDPTTIAFFLFQFVFCGTAATIVSGAIAERMTFSAYILISIVVSVVIYPIYGHWVWGGADQGVAAGFLNSRGFVDFAGSSVVHSVGGWTALAAVIIIGARIGRFGANGQVNKINPSSIPLMVTGVFILWFGWIGFNGGSTLAMNAAVPGIVMNTLIAACAGGVFGLFFGWWRNKIANCEPLINGVLAGLVAITAGCHAVTPSQALLIGVVGAMVMMAVEHLLLKMKLDDAVGAVPVHLGAGIWGTLAVGIFGNLETLGTNLTRFEQVGIQLLGIVMGAVWSFPLAFVSLKLIHRWVPLRVTAEQEYDGLNVAEHGATTEIMDFFKVLDKQEKTGDLSLRAPVEPFTEVGQIAIKYNKVLSRVESESKNLQKSKSDIDSILRSVSEGLIVINPDLTLAAESSRAALRLLQVEKLEGQSLESILFPYGDKNPNQDSKIQILNLIATAFALFIPEQFNDLAASTNKQIRFPTSESCHEFRSFRISFSTVVENGNIAKVIMVISDETELRDLRSAVSGIYRQMASNLRHINALMSDEETRVGLRQYLEEMVPIAATASDSIEKMDLDDVASLFRNVHTIKGGARMFKLDFIQHFAHSVEEKLDFLRKRDDRKLSEGESQELVENMQFLQGGLQTLRAIESISESKLTTNPEQKWASFVNTMVSSAVGLAGELGKVASVQIAGTCLPVGRDLSILSTCLVHMIRNSLDHGIEFPEERLKSGKLQKASIEIGLRIASRRIEMLVRDDGRGVDGTRVIDKAKKQGLPGADTLAPTDLIGLCQLLTSPGFSSKSEVTTVSGRGVGLDSVKAELDQVGGGIALIESSRSGTLFEIWWPAQDGLTMEVQLREVTATSELPPKKIAS